MQAKRGREVSVPFVVFMQGHVVETRGEVHGGKEDSSPQCSEIISLMRQQVCILHCPSIEPPEIRADAQISIFLLYEDEG